MATIQGGVVSASTRDRLAKLKQNIAQRKENPLQTSSASSNMISSNMMTPSLPVHPPVEAPKPLIAIPESKPFVPSPQMLNPVVEALRLTPKRRASIVIERKPQVSTLFCGINHLF
jgi:hypothetical protein